jgi:hypothetical protein
MLGTILTIGTTTDLLAYAETLFTDFWQIIALAIGISLAFYIIDKILTLFGFNISEEEKENRESFLEWKETHPESDLKQWW